MATFDYDRYKSVLTDATGKRLTSGLFAELADPTTASKPVFKLSDWRKTYVRISDPTGYKAALELIGDWDHWQLLCANPKFAAHLAEWNKEVDTKLRSEAIDNLLRQAATATGTAAAKWLAESGYLPKRRKRGEDNSAEEGTVEKETKQKVASDMKRLGLIAGGKS